MIVSNFLNIYIYIYIYIYICFIFWLLFGYVLFFNCYLAVPRPTMPTMDNYQGGSLTHSTHSMLITAFSNFWPKDHQGHRNKVGFISPANHLVGFELGTFHFWLKCLNPLGQYVYYNILSKLDPSTKPHWIFLKHILSQPQGIQGNRKFLKSKIDI